MLLTIVIAILQALGIEQEQFTAVTLKAVPTTLHGI